MTALRLLISPQRQLPFLGVGALSPMAFRNADFSRGHRAIANFERHPKTVTPAAKVKLVRYQHNPTPNWGPGARPQKRRREEGDE